MHYTFIKLFLNNGNMLFFRCDGTDPKTFASSKCQHTIERIVESFWLQMGFDVLTENINLQKVLEDFE